MCELEGCHDDKENVYVNDLEWLDTGKFMWNFDGLTPIEFNNVIQALNWSCAIQFSAHEIANRIRNDLDYEFRYDDLDGFTFNKWLEDYPCFLKKILLAKFRQDEGLKRRFLRTTYGKEITYGGELYYAPVIEEALTSARDELLLDGMLTVGEFIDHLSKYDRNAHILIGEMNAFDGGFWQHTTKNILEACVRSVEEEKKFLEEHDPKYLSETKDFKYAKDNDVIVRF